MNTIGKENTVKDVKEVRFVSTISLKVAILTVEVVGFANQKTQ